MSENITPDFSQRAVSLYGAGDAMDDFPVLKAFQQYIDAEHAKARKRLLAMAVFFGAFTLAVVAVFVALLVSAGARNQQLNDRLVEFAMKERSSASPVVVQPPQDSSAVLALTARLEEIQRKAAEDRAKAEKALAEAEEKARQAAAAAAPRQPTPEEREIARLKAQLAAEREKASAEKARQREAELEAYRRRHYPELYEKKIDQLISDLDRIAAMDDEDPLADDEGDGLGEDDSSGSSHDSLTPIDYLGGHEEPAARPAATRKPKAAPAKSKSAPAAKKAKAASPAKAEAKSVSVGSGSSSVDWDIPE